MGWQKAGHLIPLSVKTARHRQGKNILIEEQISGLSMTLLQIATNIDKI